MPVVYTCETFFARVEVTHSGCWKWLGCKNASGYGLVNHEGRQQRAHRVAWQLFKSPDVPPHLHHLCRNRDCVRPEHLQGLAATEHQRLHHPDTGYCPNGHPWTDETSYVWRDGYRRCRACHRESMARYKAANLEKVRERNREYMRRYSRRQ